MSKESKGRADNIDKLVSRKLKIRRMMLGLNQQDLAKAVDVSIQQVQKYENGRNRIACGKLFLFAKFLKIPISYFYEQHDNLNNQVLYNAFAEESAEYDATDGSVVGEKEVISLVKAFSEIKNYQSRKKVIELVKTMA